MSSLPRLGFAAAVAMSALTFSGCASMRVNSFQERGVDLTQYRTYDWAADDQLVTGDPRLDNNPFFLERLQADVEKGLASRGFEKTSSGTPELVLHYHARIDQRLDMGGVELSDGSCTDCRPTMYDAGTVLLDFVDARTSKLVWRGWAEGSMNAGIIDRQDLMEGRIDEAVTRILARLPHRGGGA